MNERRTAMVLKSIIVYLAEGILVLTVILLSAIWIRNWSVDWTYQLSNLLFIPIFILLGNLFLGKFGKSPLNVSLGASITVGLIGAIAFYNTATINKGTSGDALIFSLLIFIVVTIALNHLNSQILKETKE